MTDQALNILKFALLGLLYLFFARVLWAVWSEVRTPVQRRTTGQPGTGPVVHASTPTSAKERRRARKGAQQPDPKPPRGRADRVGRLVILEPRPRRGATFAMTGEITLGRDPSCSIPIDNDAYISQLHVRFYNVDGQAMVEDLGSTNGTFHNGNKVTGAKLLHPGDRVQVGTIVIEAQ